MPVGCMYKYKNGIYTCQSIVKGSNTNSALRILFFLQYK